MIRKLPTPGRRARWACAAGVLAGCAGSPLPAPADAAADAAVDQARGAAPPPPGGDALPAGAIAFFKTPLCPNGWFPYGPAVGRLLVPTVGAAGVGEAHGTPLGSGEDRAHAHRLVVRLELRAVSYVGAAGEGNRGVARAAPVMLATTIDPASAGLPYLQLLVCQKGASARPARRALPRGLLAFFAQPACPDGWTQAGATQGRLLVGLPEQGAPDQTFGGPPLMAGAGRAHGHEVSGTVSLPGHGIALASGCCAGGYAQSGDYAYAGTVEETDGAPPYLRLLQCQKL